MTEAELEAQLMMYTTLRAFRSANGDPTAEERQEIWNQILEESGQQAK
jgi:hypothetical protein